MKRLQIVSTIFICFILVGCGTQVALSGRAYDDYQKSIKPYIAYWEKEGMTEEARMQDWLVCGGQKNGSFAWDSRKKIPDETDDYARTRLQFEFQRCMLRAGYHYTGNCSSEDVKSQPLCGAP